MLFHEIYGSYYSTVSAVLAEAIRGGLTGKRINEIVMEKAFGESITAIPEHLRDQSWPLLRPDLTTPIRQEPRMPLTLLQKQWMKALLTDPRIALFAPDTEGLEETEPLFAPDTFVYYDRYEDGDPFTDPQYIACFRTILRALRERRYIRIRFRGHRGTRHTHTCVPLRLEYSPKDDKFRLMASADGRMLTVNLSRVRSCELLEPYPPEKYQPIDYRECSVELELTDERNALERVMLHFSDLEKETVRLDEKRYRVTLYYKHDDETELLIRILSFGAVLRVISPEDTIRKLRDRLEKQIRLRKNMS